MGTIFLVLGLASAVTRLEFTRAPDRTEAGEELAQSVRSG